MEHYDIYKDIAQRTDGAVFLGVVGACRTGKSTFIKRFMDLLVLPNIENTYTKERTRDELPQSGSGKNIMTTEPKFVPNEAVPITIGDNVNLKVRMVDCVGYIVPGAEGYMDEDGPRMINTPWSKEPMPFMEAAEIGTKKVINDHSTIGIVVATDGSVTEIPRENYLEAEGRVINELKGLGKPFVVLLNTNRPYADETEALRQEMSSQYGVTVMPVNCAQLKPEDIKAILENVLYEFPMKEIRLHFPRWIEMLENEHWLKKQLISYLKQLMDNVDKLTDIKENIISMQDSEIIKKAYVNDVLLGEGAANVDIAVDDGLFYRILSETTGMPIENDYQLISTIKQLANVKNDYDKVERALSDVKRRGYGVVAPIFEDVKLEQPEVFKQGSRYGIKLKAKGESIHIDCYKQKLIFSKKSA